MKRLNLWMTACAVACVAFTSSAAVGQVESEVFISYDEMNIGNGDFNVTQADVDAGLVLAVNAFGTENEITSVDQTVEGAPADPILALNRHRVLRDTGGTGNAGVILPGWGITREFYMGGNGAMGTDGNYGFAASPYEEGNDMSGQAFANTGRIRITSNNYDFNFASGTTIDFDYLVGSDTIRGDNGQPLAALATPSLVFDLGLPTEFREDFAQETGVGSGDPSDPTNLDFNRRSGTYTTTDSYSTVQLRFDLTNELQLGDTQAPQGVLRSLLDKVSLSATGERSSDVLLGDFDLDGDVDLADLDQYNGNIGADPTGPLEALDLDDDGDIDGDDLAQHYTDLVETSNGQKGTFAGDLNLDGSVNVLGDAFPLVGSLGNAATSWSQGDFNGDGQVNVLGDAFALVGNLGKSNAPASGASAAAVPEPGSIALLTLAGMGVAIRRRR